MISKFTITYLLFVTSFVHTVRSQAVVLPTGCACQAVDLDNPGKIIKDFGVVIPCDWNTNCDCTAPQGNAPSCLNICEHVVARWAANSCPRMFQGREVRAQFQSPTCLNAEGNRVIDCAPRQCFCPCPIPVDLAPAAGAGPGVAGAGPIAGADLGVGPVVGADLGVGPVAGADLGVGPVAGADLGVGLVDGAAPVAGAGIAVDLVAGAGIAPVAEPVAAAGPAIVAGVGAVN